MQPRLLFLAVMLLMISSVFAVAAEEHYLCDGNTRLTATFTTPPNGRGSVELVFPVSNERIILPQVLSADGGRYSAGDTEFWIKGSQATLTRAGKSTMCKL